MGYQSRDRSVTNPLVKTIQMHLTAGQDIGNHLNVFRDQMGIPKECQIQLELEVGSHNRGMYLVILIDDVKHSYNPSRGVLLPSLL